MIVRCKHKSRKALHDYYGVEYRDALFRLDISPISDWSSLELDKEYLVMGVFNGSDGLDFLIDFDDFPIAYSALHFEIIDNQIPSTWMFKAHVDPVDGQFEVKSRLGYREFALEEDHYVRLVERNRPDVEIYLQRLRETKEALGLVSDTDDEYPPSTWLP